MVPKYYSLKKNDIRNERVHQYFSKISTKCYDDWKIKDKEQKDKEKEAELAEREAASPKKKAGTTKDAKKTDKVASEAEEEKTIVIPEILTPRSSTICSNDETIVYPRDKTLHMSHEKATDCYEN